MSIRVILQNSAPSTPGGQPRPNIRTFPGDNVDFEFHSNGNLIIYYGSTSASRRNLAAFPQYDWVEVERVES